MKKEIKWSYEIGEIIRDNKRNIIIISREKRVRYRKEGWKCNEKWYRYKCNVCSFNCGKHYNIKVKEYKEEHWIEESNLLKGEGCSCCSGKIVVKEINDIATTCPNLIKYFKNKEDVYTHTYLSNKKVTFKCPHCENEKIMAISVFLKNGLGCNRCSDGTPYSEKIIFSLLKQLKIKFQTQLSKTTFKWCEEYRYDFYFKYNNNIYIIESHGNQHYKETGRKNSRTLNEEQANDESKKQLAIENKIKEDNYIIIDCRKSNLEFIKQNILNSKLNELFDLSKIDWVECEKFTYTSFIKIACDYKKNNPNMTTSEIGEIMGFCKGSISKWLKMGNKINLCVYDTKIEKDKSLSIGRVSKRKPIICIENGIIFESIADCERRSESIFGVKLLNSNITSVCKGVYKKYKGYTFKYV